MLSVLKIACEPGAMTVKDFGGRYIGYGDVGRLL